MIKLSIITINYNDAEGLRKTLASVAAQTYANIQHVIVDGGSTDGSVEILKAYPQPLPEGRGEEPTPNPSLKGGEMDAAPKYSTDANRDDYPYQNPEHKVLWVTEPDKGIYNAMNKGIEIALGKRVVNDDHTSQSNLNVCSMNVHSGHPIEHRSSPIKGRTSEHENNSLPFREELEVGSHYIQILNAGDILAAPDVTEKMFAAMNNFSSSLQNINPCRSRDIDSSEILSGLSSKKQTVDNNLPCILYGNMLKVNSLGALVGKSGYTEYSLRQFYSSTLNHDCAYIQKDLFEEYGLYDENLKIVSDWKWYLQAIGLGRVNPEYVDIDVTIFDDGGISETNLELRNKERRQVLEELLPPAVLWDYDQHAFEVEQVNRLRRWHLYPLVYFMERVLFKLEKWFAHMRRGYRL